MERSNVKTVFFIITLFFVLSSFLSTNASTKSKTITDFEASVFFKKQTIENKDSWDLHTGGKNNFYAFVIFQNK